MLQHLYARARALDQSRADALLAAVFATTGVVESIFVKAHGDSRLLTAAFAVAFALPVALRRHHTLGATLLFAALAASAAPLNTFVFTGLTTPFIILLVIAYTVGRHETGSRIWVDLALLAAVVPLTGGIRSPGDVLWTAIFIVCPALAGRAIRSRMLFQQEMREKASRLQADRELRALRAVEDERGRIASELQAIVANNVSAMVVQAEAVPRLVNAGDRQSAGQALAVIEESGRDALAEMRRLLGVLRRDDDGPVLAPQPTLARAGALVSRMQARGLDAGITVQGEPIALSPGVDLAGYRVVEEALSSALGAAGASHAEVSIVYGDNNVLVKVSDDRENSGPREPDLLRALRERVNLYGGTLRAVPREGGRGLEIEARLPIGGPR